MTGWTGRVLHIDLTLKKSRVELCDQDIHRFYLGGKGFCSRYLRECASLPWDHRDMVITVFTGPLTGTFSPTSGRTHMASKSPLTNLVGDASVGGRLGFNLKKAGWDGIVITGISSRPVGIEIQNEQVTFEDAAAWWGLTTSQVCRGIPPGKASLSVIGPAAENGVRFASVTVDQHHAAGRTGLGLSFAQKKIKYLKILGTGNCTVTHPDRLKQARQDILRMISASSALMGRFGFTRLGTGAIYDLIANRRMMPTDNFLQTHFENASLLNAAAYQREYTPEKHACRGCHIACKKIGTKNNTLFTMPEFETMSHFTALVGSTDIDLVVTANQLCNDYGMDTISAASVLACRREILGEEYTSETLLGLLEDMARARGEGRVLSLGAARYARKMGRPEAAMAVKGLELPAYDPRGAYGMALGYAFSTRGGCHLRAYPISHEILRKPVATDRFSFSGKSRIIKIAEDLNAVIDSLTACKFSFFAAGLEEYADAFYAVTGVEMTVQDLLETGERICYNERIINAINGVDAKDDDLPDRFFQAPGSSGNGIQINPIDRQAFLEARQRYYTIRGLDKKGLPKPEKAKSLGLSWNN